MKLLKKLCTGLVTSALILGFAGCANLAENAADPVIEPAAATRSTVNLTCDSEIKTVDTLTKASTIANGTWYYADWSSQAGKKHISGQSYSSTNGGSHKFYITPGRYQVIMYMAFSNTDKDAKLSFEAFGRRESSTTAIKLKQIDVMSDDGKTKVSTILSTETALTTSYSSFTKISTSSISSTYGWLRFTFDMGNEAVSGDSIYFDNIKIAKSSSGTTNPPSTSCGAKWSGFRFSQYGIETGYGAGGPSNSKWNELLELSESKFPGSQGAIILIVGEAHCKDKSVAEGKRKFYCGFNFPKPSNCLTKYATYESKDKYEDFLTMCDQNGYAVWLQAEGGDDDGVALLKTVLNRYKHHSSVKGFGLDNEWYKRVGEHGYGTKITDSEAKALVKAAREINSNYTVFLKHWETEYMPPNYRDGLIFVDSSQRFISSELTYDQITSSVISEARESMIKEFTSWADHFSGNPVFFQVGYSTLDKQGREVGDKRIWTSDPVGTCQAIINSASKKNNQVGMFWVDFTLSSWINRVQ